FKMCQKIGISRRIINICLNVYIGIFGLNRRKLFMFVKNRMNWIFAVMFGVTILLVGCGDTPNTSGKSVESNSSGEIEQQDDVRGVTDDEIVIGNIVAHTGPQAIYGLLADSAQVYFDYVNENGGINGRKVNFVTLDGEYQPAKAVQQAQRIIEEEEAFLMLASD